MTTVTRTSTTPISATPAVVWKELDAGFLDISAWAGGVRSSIANPATPEGSNGSTHGGRICDIEGVGETDERLIAFDAVARTMTYSVRASGLPFFVDHLENTWTVNDDGSGGTSVDVVIRGITKGIVGRIAAFPLGRMLGPRTDGAPGRNRTCAHGSGNRCSVHGASGEWGATPASHRALRPKRCQAIREAHGGLLRTRGSELGIDAADDTSGGILPHEVEVLAASETAEEAALSAQHGQTVDPCWERRG
jgi:hypothetical protein